MIRLLHVLSVMTGVVAGGVLALCAFQWSRSSQEATPLAALTEAARPGAAGEVGTEAVPPLVAAAQSFASYLSPPAPPARVKPVIQETPRPAASVLRPQAPAPKFKVLGTICAGRSERSIALIQEAGAENVGRWVREGAQIGHFVIHEIRPGSVVYLDGEKSCEMAMERGDIPTSSIAKDSRPEPARSQPAANHPPPAQAGGRAKRSSGGGNFTVGSARTSALD